VAALHVRASLWHEQQGLIDEAVRYALLAPDFERAAALIEQYAMALILQSSHVLVVRTWIEQVPRSLILTRPRLALVCGWVLTFNARFDAAEQLLVDAAQALDRPDLPADVAGELAGLRSSIARFRGNADQALALAQQALEHLVNDNSWLRAGAALNIGVARMWRGETAAAGAALAEAAPTAERVLIDRVAATTAPAILVLSVRFMRSLHVGGAGHG